MKFSILVENSTQDKELCAEHGLSIYIEALGYKILFDFGQSELFAENACKLGIDLGSVDFAVLSHGHYDHSGGMRRFMQINKIAPVYVSRMAFQPHYNASGKYIGVDLEGVDLSRIRYVEDAFEIVEGIMLISCNDRKNITAVDSFGQTTVVGEQVISDDYRHEQYLVIHENGKRVCFSGCSHKGILNIVHWLLPDVLIGGFHYMKIPLTGEGEALLKHSARELLSGGTYYFTGHCTGDEQYEIMKAVMGDKLCKISCGLSVLIR